MTGVPCAYLVGASCSPSTALAYTSTNLTVTGEGGGNYIVTGLNNGQAYNVTVAAVDNYGNVGTSASPLACGQPAPVNDFWKLYRDSGGGAGGFCALEAVGTPAGSSAALAAAGLFAGGLVRRRGRRKGA